MLRTTFNAEITYLEVNKEDAKYKSFVLRLKYNKEWALIVFRGLTA